MGGKRPKSEKLRVRLGKGGWLLIPVAFRESLGVNPGDVLIARCEESRLILETADAVKRRLRERFARIPAEESLVDELVAERRDAARTEGRP